MSDRDIPIHQKNNSLGDYNGFASIPQTEESVTTRNCKINCSVLDLVRVESDGGHWLTTNDHSKRCLPNEAVEDGSPYKCICETMSVCLETSNVLASSVGTSTSVSPQLLGEVSSSNNQSVASAVSISQSTVSTNVIQAPLSCNVVQLSDDKLEQQVSTPKSIAKLVVANHTSNNQCLQKVVNPPLITVLNPSGPLTVVKTLCVTAGVSSAPQFTLNSAPLTVTNAVGKSPTITLLNAPVTVVKTITGPPLLEKVTEAVSSAATTIPTIIENRGHNVFVKNTCPESTIPEVAQNHKFLFSSYPPTNVLTNVNTQPKTVNGQRNKLKILSNVVLPSTSQVPTNNVILNKSSPTQRYMPRQKVIGPNGAPTKYLNKPPMTNNAIKPQQNVNPNLKMMQDKVPPNRMVYPTHKSQIKNMPPYMMPKSVKTIVPQHKNIPGQVQRTGSGVRTIPPQRPQKLGAPSATKPNYIGKHAVQAHKMRHSLSHNKLKSPGLNNKIPSYNVHGPQPTPQPPDKQLTELTFNQALTAQIIETLSNNSSPMPSNRYEILPTRYDHAFSCPDNKQSINEHHQTLLEEEKEKTPLDTLSLICHAVLLDHNYNATLPSDSPTRPSPPINMTTPVNAISTSTSVYSPSSGKRRSLATSNTISAASLSNVPVVAVNNNTLMVSQDDDAASDISDGSERKNDTEGEETDTAPEAEAVTKDNFDGCYGDYVTRCICGFVHDDGYMVECDRCKVWQHVQCVLKNRQVPDEYLCEICDPIKPVDKQKARTIQQQWLRDRQFADPKLRKDIKIKEAFKPKETISDTDSSDGEQPAHNIVSKGRTIVNRRKSENHQKPLPRQRREASKEVVQRRQKRREKRIVRKKVKPTVKSHSDDENQDTWASHLPQLRQWIEKYEEAVTNHYSPELRARISNIRVNGTHSDLSMQFDSTVHKCRVHAQPLTEIKYLVSTVHLNPNTPIIELRGKYMLSTQHRNSGGGSLTTRQHSQRPGPFLFFYRLQKDNTEVCVDTRTYGNIARFIRRSCKPNSELRHCIEKGHLHLYLVSITSIDKNTELTIKHESHDLAAIGTTQIACACGNLEECTVNKTTIKKNGEVSEIHSRKRRGRRTISSHIPEPEQPKPIKEEPPPPTPPVTFPPELHSPVKEKPEPDLIIKKDLKEEPIETEVIETKLEIKEEIELKEEPLETKKENCEETDEEIKDIKVKEEIKSPPTTPIATRRSSHYKSDKEDDTNETKEQKDQSKKKSREERKLEAILRAIEQMEKKDAKKQEHKEKQAHRRESEPGPTPKEDEKSELKVKRRRRKGRARTVSQSARRNRVNSTDSCITSGDENMLSPSDSVNHLVTKSSIIESSSDQTDNRAVGLLLALSNGDNTSQQQNERSPTREMDSNSNSLHSSPETQLSSACLLVQAAVEPLEPGFKFPKTKKGLMNEWLNKVPEPVQSASSISPSSLTPHINNNSEDSNMYMTPTKNLAALAQAVTFCDKSQPRGSAKKRWLRQAIREDQSCDSPGSRPESPPISDMVAPPKKRRLPRESLSTDISPPTTPTSLAPPTIKLDSDRQEGCVEIVYSGTDGDSPTQTLESDAILKERAAKMKQEYNIMKTSERNDMNSLGCLMDPRLSRDARIFHNSDLVGTVEKALSILGVENTKPETTMPKRKVKLSITEYRQRKKLNNNDKNDEAEQEPEQISNEENNSSESFKLTSRPRSGSTSSSTSLTSSDDDITMPEINTKAPAFNSEPTELERQREISRLRLKKAFGLSIVEEPRPVLNVEAILNLELEPKVKPIPIPSPTFPIPGSADNREMPLSNKTSPTLDPAQPVAPDPPTEPLTPPPPPPPPPLEARTPSPTKMETEDISAEEDSLESLNEDVVEETGGTHTFYTPDEEDANKREVKQDVSFEEAESVSYVPPFNNPVYPNDSFTAYTSTIDDDARYEGRNPSPPPNLEQESFTTKS